MPGNVSVQNDNIGVWPQKSISLFFRLLVKLQAEELQVHAGELSRIWRQLDEEKEIRANLEKTQNSSSFNQQTSQPSIVSLIE